MRLLARNRQKIWVSILFLLPCVLIYSVLVIYPIIYSGYLSLTKWNGIGEKEFIGLINFTRLFANSDFLLSLKNTLMVTGISLLLQIPIGLVLAYMLFRTKFLFKTFRAIYFVPVVIAPTAIGTMFSILLNNEVGVFKSILEFIGLGALSRPWLSDSSVVLYVVILIQVWQYIGTYIIIFLTSLQSIDEQIFESALIDGANAVQTFFRIAIPQMRAILIVAVVFCFTGSMKSFDLPFIMTNGGPGYISSYLGNYMHRQVFQGSNFGLGSAVTIVILIISLVFSLIFNRLAREKD
ncbi:MAG: sugar ABC transporter permease [Anaerolineaceae bacterium]|nr:MAG: sugar ABC transporter permease [Anaerolineaceae bacterium]